MLLEPDIITRVLERVDKRPQARAGYTPSAVLMLFFDRGKETYLVYIRRTTGMTLHSGHMAFPGGKIDPQDASSFATAARETREEIGVPPSAYVHLGDMGFFETLTSRFDAAAHLAWCKKPPVYNINRTEVAEVVEIPLRVLAEQFRPELNISNRQEVYYLNFHYQPQNGEVANLWGLTARITHHFLAGLYGLSGKQK